MTGKRNRIWKTWMLVIELDVDDTLCTWSIYTCETWRFVRTRSPLRLTTIACFPGYLIRTSN